MKEVTLEDLKAKFVVAKVAPYGEVIMVPGGDFDPDWEPILEDQGFGCVFTEINDEKFTLVRLEKEEAEEEIETEPSHVPKREDSERFTKHRGAPLGKKVNYWSDADEERLMKRIEEMPRTTTFEDKCAQLVSEFPGRTATGLEKKYLKLKRLGKSRSRVGKTLTKKLLEEQESRRLQDANREQVRKFAESASKGDLEDLPRIDPKLHCAIVMQALEAQERRGSLMIPAKLRARYLDALTDLNKGYVDTFLEKARSLVEASS